MVQLDQDLLAERERAVLSVERSWWLTYRSIETAIRAELAMTPSPYYRLLHDVIDRDRALAYDPLVVLRLRRARRTRRRARSEGRTVSSPPNEPARFHPHGPNIYPPRRKLPGYGLRRRPRAADRALCRGHRRAAVGQSR